MGALTGHQAGIELTTIYEISKILSSSLDLNKTAREVLGMLSSHLRMRRGMVSLVQPSGDLHVVEATGMSAEAARRGRFRRGEGITGKILATGVPMVVPNVAKEPLFLNRTESRSLAEGRVVAFIGVPIKVGRETVGVLSVDREMDGEPGNFEADVRFLAMVANLIGQTTRLHNNVAAEREELMQRQYRLQKELQGKYSLDNVIGHSKRMQDVFAEVHQAAPGRSTVLLRGESGTGKEVIARSIHYLSPRKLAPFIKVNCAALSETLLESELFGHEKGSFTGATQERKGRFEMAQGGTLFLDEIGEISPLFQTKLLRVLQEREFERVGGNKSIKVDVRLIAATNRNMEEDVAKGTFRADLYYRINVVSIFLSPLRERREDIPPLIEHFLDKFNKENERKISISPAALAVMLKCNWPGNVRELENCVERTATMTRKNMIQELDLPCQQNKCFSQVLQHYGQAQLAIPIPVVSAPIVSVSSGASMPEVSGSSFGEATAGEDPAFMTERERLVWAMEQCGWVQAKAARLLNLTPRQIGYALSRYNIEVKRL
ncbi:nitrogenase (molybdenum-iron)-specific transcriptional regulator NifA [Sulfuriferula multivorans]|uniref:Nif-specific regulatory protein n=1 Tax=Sulfuriferula multivorans TaxID=1559896 RepID=A0A401JC68_9PROT|nr:nif-specific transcriptional activator NifA [Sulfuriferula multivorans]GBL45189.1 nitrogenase (molybdenum-iron)-specific transcriptional regulator NifA [Sulfuriferula multivorans]